MPSPSFFIWGCFCFSFFFLFSKTFKNRIRKMHTDLPSTCPFPKCLHWLELGWSWVSSLFQVSRAGSRAQGLGPSSAFAHMLVVSWISSRTAEFATEALKRCQHHRWRLNLLCHSACPSQSSWILFLLQLFLGLVSSADNRADDSLDRGRRVLVYKLILQLIFYSFYLLPRFPSCQSFSKDSISIFIAFPVQKNPEASI